MKITLTPASKLAELIVPAPVKASSMIPEWFKQIPTHEEGYDGNRMSRNVFEGTSLTVRGCNPFLDTLTSGYIFTLAADVEFKWEEDQFAPSWLVDYALMEGQAEYQTKGIPQIHDRVKYVYKFSSGWKINTPKGYSTLFTHPLNRHDLPFRTFSGIVETDKYNVQTDFPFQVIPPEDGSPLLIEKGTPICQAIPFIRDEWKSEILPFNEEEEFKNRFNLRSKLDGSYRSQFWERKKYS